MGNGITAQLTMTDSLDNTEIMSSFQSAKDRFNRMSHPGANGGESRNLGTSTWRRSMGEFKVGDQPVLTHKRSISDMAGEEKAVSGSASPRLVCLSQSQLKSAYAYAIRRADGQLTQLIRADELETLDLSKIPTTQGPEGLLALPLPELERPEQRGGDVCTPYKEHGNPSKDRALQPQSDSIQSRIDAICATNLTAAPSPEKRVATPRRQKIYCDKWIHEGVCAFTQLGCKYRHEMPLDKATQLSLGLNHGLPSWYKRAHAVQIRPEQQGSPVRAAGPWRRPDSSSSMSTGYPLGTGLSSSPAAASPYGQQCFGPIGRPPPPPYQQPSIITNNQYAILPEENMQMGENDEDEETIMWTGRGR